MSSEVYCDFLTDLVDGFRRGEVPLFLTVRYYLLGGTGPHSSLGGSCTYLLTYAASRQNLKCRGVSSPRVAVSENLPRQDISYGTSGRRYSQSPITTSATEKNEKNEKKNDDDDDDCLFHITIDDSDRCNHNVTRLSTRHLREPHPP